MAKHFVKVVDHPDEEHAFLIQANIGKQLEAKVEFIEQDCNEHPDCTVIVMRQEGRLLSLDGLSDEERKALNDAGVNFEENKNGVVWCNDAIEVPSHMHNSVHTEHRLNKTYPRAKGKNKKVLKHSEPCDDCVANEYSPW